LQSHLTYEEEVWWAKSMIGGYSEAFAFMSGVHAAHGYYDKKLECLVKGIEAGSPSAMLVYSELETIKIVERIYWLGQAWLAPFSKGDQFLNSLVVWHATPDHPNVTEGFVYGYIIDGLDKGKFNNKLQRNDANREITAISEAHQIYQKMCNNCKEAVNAWCLAGRRVGVVKDIIRLIGKMVWRSRDQPQWYLNESI
jgi:hypothetical protein